MNKENANAYFPLYMAEMYEYFQGEIVTPSDESQLLVRANLYKMDNVDGEWNLVYAEDVVDILIACPHLITIADRLENGLEIINLGYDVISSPPIAVGNRFPLRKIVVKEFVYGRDTGSSWSDPENDIRKSCSGEYYLQDSLNGDWVLDYDERFGSLGFGLIVAAQRQIQLIQDIPYEFSAYNKQKNDGNIAMFSTIGHMFKFKYHFPDQKAICGEALTDYFNDYEGDKSIKLDYLHDYVSVYKKGEATLFQRKLYLDGEMIATLSDLSKQNITQSDVEWGNQNFKDYLKQKFPNAQSMSANFSWYRVH